ncbi:glycosyl transferase family 1 [bacterium]|nr:MAG: glycosyl transferase family 1 [bacterium]
MQRKAIEDYREIVGDEYIASIFKKARKLYGKHILHVNSTYQGGGVAEILVSLVPLLNNIGISTGWRILHGTPDFFTITKKIHNALQGEKINLSKIKKILYRETVKDFSIYTHIHHDCVIIHDNQPLPLIEFYNKRQPWIWRCHVDLSAPQKELWDFLLPFILRYDKVIVSNKNCKRKGLPVEQKIIHPAIDPLSPKNKELSNNDIKKYLKKNNIPTDKPLITQISRFDKWKDPLGVVDIFKLVRKKVDCRLVLCGGMATDDPEGIKICEQVRCKTDKMVKNGDVIIITTENNILVNILQRVSSVIIQKSLREGFGLTVAEALWKERPVVASKIGGIPLQIKDGESGFLLDPKDKQGFADRIVQILRDPKLAKKLGKNGKKNIKENFLITRLISDHLDCLDELITCK